MKLLIDVTQQDIDNGEANNCYECPIAMAVKRAAANAGMAPVTVDVNYQTITILTGFGERFLTASDDEIEEFVNSFDGWSEGSEGDGEEDFVYAKPNPFQTTLEFLQTK